LFTRTSRGSNQYTDALQKELDLSYEDAERLKKGENIAGVAEDTADHPLRSVTDISCSKSKTFDFSRDPPLRSIHRMSRGLLASAIFSPFFNRSVFRNSGPSLFAMSCTGCLPRRLPREQGIPPRTMLMFITCPDVQQSTVCRSGIVVQF